MPKRKGKKVTSSQIISMTSGIVAKLLHWPLTLFPSIFQLSKAVHCHLMPSPLHDVPIMADMAIHSSQLWLGFRAWRHQLVCADRQHLSSSLSLSQVELVAYLPWSSRELPSAQCHHLEIRSFNWRSFRFRGKDFQIIAFTSSQPWFSLCNVQFGESFQVCLC